MVEKTSTKKRKKEKENIESAAAAAPTKKVKNDEKFSFDINSFRVKLHSKDFIWDLEQFNKHAKTNPEVVREYINANGTISEVCNTLKSIEKSNLTHCSVIFETIHLVLLDLVANTENSTEDVKKTCNNLIKGYEEVIETMLIDATKGCAMQALKLLIALVACDAETYGSKILKFSCLTKEKQLSQMFPTQAFPENGTESIRTHFVNLVLAFIIDGNLVLIKGLIFQQVLLSLLFSNLHLDSPDQLVLTFGAFLKFTLQTKYLEKNMKLKLFNANIVNSIYSVVHAITVREFDERPVPEYAASALEIMYEFLTILLSSRKFGIVQVMEPGNKKHSLQFGLLKAMKKYWGHPALEQMVIEIIKNIPNLTHVVLSKIMPHIKPKIYDRWFEVCNFTINLLSSIDPKITMPNYGLGEVQKTIKLIINLSTSPILLQQFDETTLFRPLNTKVRSTVVELLLMMLTKCNGYLSELSKLTVTFKEYDIKKIRLQVKSTILAHFPSVDTLLNLLYISVKDEKSVRADLLKQLEYTVDLLLIIEELMPELIQQSAAVCNFFQMLRPIYEQDIKEASAGSLEDAMKLDLELKVVRLMFVLDPMAVYMEGNMIDSILKSFVKVAIVGGSGQQQRKSALKVLSTIFQNTGLFDDNILEISCWLDVFQYLPSDSVGSVVDFLIKLLTAVKKDKTLTTISVSTLSEDDTAAKNYSETFESIEKGESDGMMVCCDQFVTLSPLFSAIFKIFSKKELTAVKRFLEVLALNLFHYFPTPSCIVEEFTAVDSQVNVYFKRYTQKKKLTPLDDTLLNETTSICRYSAAFFNKEKSFAKLFGQDSAESGPLFTIHDEQFRLIDNMNVYSHIFLTTFYVRSLLKTDSFDAEQAEVANYYLAGFFELLHQTDAHELDNCTTTGHVDSLTAPALKYIYQYNLYFLDNFELLENSNIDVGNFIVQLTDSIKHLPDFQTYLGSYHQKICSQLQRIVKKCVKRGKVKGHCTPEVITRVLDIFELSNSVWLQILNDVTDLPYTCFVDSTTNEKTFFYEILVMGLKNLAETKEAHLTAERLVSCVQIYQSIIENVDAELNLELLEGVLHDYLSYFYHNIGSVSVESFASIFKARKIAKTTIRLAMLLYERDDRFNEKFFELLPKNYDKKELIYPLLNVAFKKGVLGRILENAELKTSIYNEYKNGILKTIEKPLKGGMIYRENLQISFELIKTCMPLPECIEFCKKSSKLAEGGAEIYQIQLIRAIYLNVMNSNSPPDVLKTTYLNFYSHLLQFANVMLKTADELDYNKLHALILITKKWSGLMINRKKLQSAGGLDFKDIRKSPNFTAFGKNCLKFGMALNYNEMTRKLDTRNSVLLKFLALVCDTMLMENSNAAAAAQFFELATTHSNFFEIALSQQLDNGIKRGLFYLLWTLVKKNSKIIDTKHVPLYLGAYHATISPTDRYILALIRFYEQSGASLYEYRPFLWGEAAVTHFALRSEDASSVKQQEVNNVTVMSIIDRRIVEATISEFPVWRKLNATQQLPQEDFEDLKNIIGLDESFAIDMASNNVQRLVEANQSKFDIAILKLAARDDNNENIIYDPAFFVPLMALMYAPESPAIGGLVNRNGMLSLVFSALACKDDEMRLAAGYVLQRGREIIENTKLTIFKQLYSVTQNGLSELAKSDNKEPKEPAFDLTGLEDGTVDTEKDKNEEITELECPVQEKTPAATETLPVVAEASSVEAPPAADAVAPETKEKKEAALVKPEVPLPSSIPLLFISHASMILPDYVHKLHKIVTSIICVKPSFDFHAAPSFHTLFNSTDVEFVEHREFILEILKNGLNSSLDFDILLYSPVMKILACTFKSPLSSMSTDTEILNIFQKIVAIPLATAKLIKFFGFHSFFNGLLENLEFFEFDKIELLINILFNMYYSFRINRSHYGNKNMEMEILFICLKFLKILPYGISALSYAKFLCVLHKTLSTKSAGNNFKLMSREYFEQFYGHLLLTVPEQQQEDVKHLRKYGAKMSENKMAYVKKVSQLQLSDENKFILLTIREIVKDWMKYNE